MARQEQDREDLLREATALVERMERAAAAFPEAVVIGFRRHGEGSIFIGADPVFQFNSRLELRRGFLDGQLLKAEHGTLVTLERRRTAGEVQLLRTELTADQTEAVLSRLHANLVVLRQTLNEQRFTIIGQVPAEADVVGHVRAWLNSLPEKVAVAAVPNVR